LEKGLKDWLAQQVSDKKKAKEAERKKDIELKKDRESILICISDLLAVHNLRERGVNFDEKLSAGVAVLSASLNALLSDGNSTKKAERGDFNDKWNNYISKSSQTLPNQELTYSELADGVSNLLSGGSLPATIPGKTEPESAPVVEPPKPKKAPKAIPVDS